MDRADPAFRWSARIWLYIALAAVLLTLLVLAGLRPRSLAWRSTPAPTLAGSPNPNLFVFPTLPPPTPTPLLTTPTPSPTP
jgi:hypothetical protein